MHFQLSMKNAAKFYTRAIVVLVTIALVCASITTDKVSAYYTVGASGRNLEVVPGFAVNEMLAPAWSQCREMQQLRSFTGVTIHETSNWSSGANAKMHALYLRGQGQYSDVSWHYSVDSTTAYQSIPESEKSWHAGDTANGTGNASTISIEICDNRDGNFDQAMANAEWLAADVLYRHGVYSVEGALFQHNQFSAYAKNCPITIRDTGRWGEFCSKTQRYLNYMLDTKGSFTLDNTGGDIYISGRIPMDLNASRVDIYSDTNTWIGSTPTQNNCFTYTLDASYYTVGWHSLRFAVIKGDGSASWSTSAFLVGPESKICMDYPSGDGTRYGDITVQGWAISHAGITRVDIYADDNVLLGSTTCRYERSDVYAGTANVNKYKNALNSGYSYTIDAGRLTSGTHTIRVAAVSADGSTQWMSKTISVGPKARICLDFPDDNTTVSESVAINGWAVSYAGIDRVDIYVDDVFLVESIEQLTERSDVNASVNTVGQYKDALNSGFSYTIAAGVLSAGKHVIRVSAVSNDGSSQSEYRTVTVAENAVSEGVTNINYQSHVQDIGWQSWVSNGAVSGTSGESKRLEAMCIKLNGLDGGIQYKTHVQDIGWMDWVADGAPSGTSGQSKRLEAIQIRLTGAAAEAYDIYYRVHAQNTGWMDWAKNGEPSGTAGYSYRLEAIQIVLLPKGAAAPGPTTRPFVQP